MIYPNNPIVMLVRTLSIITLTSKGGEIGDGKGLNYPSEPNK